MSQTNNMREAAFALDASDLEFLEDDENATWMDQHTRVHLNFDENLLNAPKLIRKDGTWSEVGI